MPEAKPKPKTYKFPATIGACVDKLFALDQTIDHIQKKADRELKPLKDEYAALEEHLIQTIPKEKLNGAVGKKATVQLDHPEFPNVKNWPKLYAYIVKNKAWDLLQKRVSSTACRERWSAKKVIPGVEVFRDTKLKLTPKK